MQKYKFYIVENEANRKQQATLEQHMASEVGLIVLDCLGLYCMHFRNVLLANEGENTALKKIFDVYLSFIQIGQSETLYRHVFASIRSFISNYSTVLFKGKYLVDLFVRSKIFHFFRKCRLVWEIMLRTPTML